MNQNETPSLFMLTTFARHMRKHPTRSEALLWAQLRRGKLGVRFRRQHPMLGFIVDFYCASARLVVEVDGGVHDSYEARRRDAARDAWLTRFASIACFGSPPSSSSATSSRSSRRYAVLSN